MNFFTAETKASNSSLDENTYYNISVHAVTALGDSEPETYMMLLTPKSMYVFLDICQLP